MRRILLFLIVLWLAIFLVGLISPRTAFQILQLLTNYIIIAVDYCLVWTMNLILWIKGVK